MPQAAPRRRQMRGYPKTFLYWGDLFHTLVNMPSWRFTVVLFFTYFTLFVTFAVPFWYDAYNNNCIPGVTSFQHAVWFSVQTSMTIGYGGELTPDPHCPITNLMVTFQSVASLLVAYSLLGVVYARFSRPTRRASTIVFSHTMVLNEDSGVPCLSVRVANIRKHQVIEANVRMLVALNNILTDEEESVFRFTSLPVLGGSQVFLGLPCIVSHPITASSPLFGLSFAMMERCDMEVLVLLEGVDASTSSKLQARHSYRPSDIRHNHRFCTMVTRQPSGRRSVDFSKFHMVVPAKKQYTPKQPSRSISHPAHLDGLGSFNSEASSTRVTQPPLATSDENSDVADTLRDVGLSMGAGIGLSVPRRSASPIRGPELPLPAATSTSHIQHANLPPASYGTSNNGSSRQGRAAQPRRRGGQDLQQKRKRRLEGLLQGRPQQLMDCGSDLAAQLHAMDLEYERKISYADAKANHWRQSLIEFAARVQQSPALDACSPAAQALLDHAQASLNHALTPD
eukprot:SM000041S15434  [mRNA]  locus=s41:75330:79490:- [translate_table: standard]